MEDTSTVSRRAADRRSGEYQRAPSRLLNVGDFVGELANEAAQAVRRAGLKPGLERSFGWEADLTGRVVAQEPQPGAELARNGLVTLYVAAPGAADQSKSGAEHALHGESTYVQSTRVLAHAEPASQGDAQRRRRKPGRVGLAAVLDMPPTPRIASERSRESALEDEGPSAEQEPVGEFGGAREEYVIAADALFAGGSRRLSRWSARIPIAWLASRLRNRSKLPRAVLALLALWLLVAGVAALFAHGSRRAPLSHSPTTRASQAIAPRAPRANPRRPTVSRERAPERRPRGRRRSRTSRHEGRAAIDHATSALASNSPSPITQPSATSSPTPAPRHEGGLFSP